MTEAAEGNGAQPRVVVLASACTATNVTTNALRAAGLSTSVVLESPLPAWRVALRRRARIGLVNVVGQVLFRLLAVPWLERTAGARKREIVEAFSLDPTPVAADVRISSVNTREAKEALRSLDPSVVVVVGTRIIASSTLECVTAPFINLHAGITPRYRGVHGGYWALVEGRPDLVGSTVHLVDAGIDTGSVLAQATFPVTGRDSFATYPLLHLAAGVPLLVEAVERVADGKPLAETAALECGESRLWHHPTLWGYLATRWLRHVA